MKASGAAAVSPADLAGELLLVWRQVVQGSTHELFSLMEELDLTITQIKTLEVLAGCASELSVKELSERLGMSLPSASRTADALVRRGWLERREDEHDRRIKRMRITDAGRDVVARVNGVRLQGLERYAAGLPDADRARLHEVLAGLPHPA